MGQSSGESMMTDLRQLWIVFPLLLGMTCAFAGPNIQHWVTERGTRVYHVEAKDLPLVDVQLLFDAGSARDGQQFGLAAMTSGLLDKGAGDWNADHIAQRLEGIGAVLGTSVSRDSASLVLRSLSRTDILKSALETMAKVVALPRFSEMDFFRERKRVLAGLRRFGELPGKVGGQAYYQDIYRGHPYGHRVLGESATVAALTVGAIREFHRRYYVASNAVAVVVGDTSRERVESMVMELTEKLPAGPPPEPIPQVDLAGPGGTQTIHFPSRQTHIFSGMAALNRHDPEYFALYVGNYILGGSGLVSKISGQIRDERGLAYSASSYFAPLAEKGPFTMSVQTRNDQAPEALAVLRKTFVNFIDNGPSEEELTRAKKSITGGFVLRIDSNSKMSNYVAMIGFYGLPIDYLDTFTDKVNSVTTVDIRKAFHSHLQLDHFQTVLVGGRSQSHGN